MNGFNDNYKQKPSQCVVGSDLATCLIISDFPSYEETNNRCPIAGARSVLLNHLLCYLKFNYRKEPF